MEVVGSVGEEGGVEWRYVEGGRGGGRDGESGALEEVLVFGVWVFAAPMGR